jgi:hypothetical protein
MDNQGRFKEDLISQYINPDRIEKTPEGFTSKVMALIETEKIPVKPAEKYRKRTLVPYLFSVFIIVLTIIVYFLPGGENQTLLIPALELLKDTKLTMPEIDFSYIFSIHLPSTMIYGLIGILLLSFLDKALFRVFHREK